MEYARANAETNKEIKDVIAKYLPDLRDAKLRVGAIEVTGAKDGFNIKVHKRPVPAKISKVNKRGRVYLEFDVLLEVDPEWLGGVTKAERAAIFHHELYRVDITQTGEDWERESDGALAIHFRPDDVVVSGFAAVIAVHQDKAIEFQELQTATGEYRQMLLKFAKPKRTDKSVQAG